MFLCSRLYVKVLCGTEQIITKDKMMSLSANYQDFVMIAIRLHSQVIKTQTVSSGKAAKKSRETTA